MPLDWFSILKRLMAVPSVAPNEAALATSLYELLRQSFPADTLELQEVSPGRYNLIMVRGTPRLTFSTHLDTVPGLTNVSENAERISGRGACDAKGQIVTQLWAIEEAATRGLEDYACFFVVGEEVDSEGARRAARHPRIGSRFLLNGEPSDGVFVKRSWGVAELTFETLGTEQHSSRPVLDSAIHKLVSDLDRVLGLREDGLSINIGRIAGGRASNVSACSATAELCVRFERPARQALQRLFDVVEHSTVKPRGESIEPFDFHVPTRLQRDAKTVTYCSDAPIYLGKFQEIMLFGPGSIDVAHSEDEYIDKRDVLAAKDLLVELLLEL